MFGSLKKFFSKQEVQEPVAPPVQPAPKPTPSSATPPGAAKPVSSGTPTASPPVSSSAPPEGSTTISGSETIKVPLDGICSHLPESIKAKFIKMPGHGPVLPLITKVVLTQLRQGAVRASFKDLRHHLPIGTFPDITEFDHTLVDVPIQIVLPLLKPTDLYPKPTQKKIEVPAEIPGLFGPHGQPLGGASAPSKRIEPKPVESAHAGPKTKETPAAPQMPKPAGEIPKPSFSAPKAGPATIPGPSIAGPAISMPAFKPAPAPAKVESIPRSPLAPAASAPPAAAPAASASSPIAMSASLRDLASAQTSVAKPTSAPAPAPASGTATPGKTLSIPVSAVSDSLPEAIRTELSSFSAAAFALPMDQVGQLLKTGKISFSWKQLRNSLTPNPPTTASAQDETAVELPLKVVAPLFMSQGRPASTQKKIVIGENIPDLFAGGSPQAKPATAPSAAAPPASASAAPAPTAPVTMPQPASAVAPAAPAPGPAAVTPKVSPDLGELFGQPEKKSWTPNEIVQKTSNLKGVEGALIAMQDGLLVASQLPPRVTGDTVAAFIPQIFGRMNQYTRELKLGELNQVTLTVDQVPWHISKVGNIYFSVVGRKGELLPLDQLAVVASELGKQNK